MRRITGHRFSRETPCDSRPCASPPLLRRCPRRRWPPRSARSTSSATACRTTATCRPPSFRTFGLVVPVAPYAPGRATNGPVAAEVLAARTGAGAADPRGRGRHQLRRHRCGDRRGRPRGRRRPCRQLRRGPARPAVADQHRPGLPGGRLPAGTSRGRSTPTRCSWSGRVRTTSTSRTGAGGGDPQRGGQHRRVHQRALWGRGTPLRRAQPARPVADSRW